MNRKLISYLLILIVIVVSTTSMFKPLFNNISYGLDLKGGFEVLYEASSLDGKEVNREMITNTYKTILKRIDVLGVSEPDVIIEGSNRIRVKLAGVTNKEEAREILSKTASLTFRDTADNLLMTSEVLTGGMARLTSDQYGLPAVMLTISDRETFFKVTNTVKDMTDNRIVIWLDFEEGITSFEAEAFRCGSLTDSKCLSAASVSQAFASNVIIQGNFTREEASNLVELINSGSIPTKLEEISSRTVGSVFGENALNKTLLAGAIGISLIILLMTLLYHFCGLIAGIGIVIYTFAVFVIFWLIGGVLTLPGIASLVLGIGMAIDACVISFERIKEEIKKGRTLIGSFVEGYKKSLSSIIDANITTFIVAIIMFIFGESSVKGFATMLMINIIMTIIIMVVIIRYVLKLFVKTNFFEQKSYLFIKVKAKMIVKLTSKTKVNNQLTYQKFNFVKKYKFFFLLSSLIITVGIISVLTMNLNLSVDFKGGTYITLISDNKIESSEIKTDINNFDYQYSDIDNINNKTVYIKLDEVLEREEIQTLDHYFKEKYNAESEVGVISNIVKKELTLNALYSILAAAIGMILYVSIRFKFTYALAALIALFHDVLIVVALFSLLRIEISVIFIAAILTIIGYSINDTVVIFDRIRENINNYFKEKKPSDDDLTNVVNTSLSENLRRTLYTTTTTLLPVICLILFGTFEIFNFNIALFIGLIIGTYSSIFLSSQIWYLLEKNNITINLNKYNIEDELDEIEIKGINK